jgi:hypothetical protein
MNATERKESNAAFVALRRTARAKRTAERCDFCGAELGEPHQQLIEPKQMKETRP